MKLLMLNQKSSMLNTETKKFIENLKIYQHCFNVFPSSIYIKDYVESGYQTGIQNISHDLSTSHTGEINILQAKSIGVKSVIIGHSERRTMDGEDDNTLLKKVELALQQDMQIIFCVGENLVDYKLKNTEKHILTQLENIFKNIKSDELKNVIIAYEPVWAIGTGMTPSIFEIEKVSKLIKKYFNEKDYDMKVLYGGSVSEKNIESLVEIENIDGFLVGGASTNYEKVVKLCEIINNSTK